MPSRKGFFGRLFSKKSPDDSVVESDPAAKTLRHSRSTGFHPYDRSLYITRDKPSQRKVERRALDINPVDEQALARRVPQQWKDNVIVPPQKERHSRRVCVSNPTKPSRNFFQSLTSSSGRVLQYAPSPFIPARTDYYRDAGRRAFESSAIPSVPSPFLTVPRRDVFPDYTHGSRAATHAPLPWPDSRYDFPNTTNSKNQVNRPVHRGHGFEMPVVPTKRRLESKENYQPRAVTKRRMSTPTPVSAQVREVAAKTIRSALRKQPQIFDQDKKIDPRQKRVSFHHMDFSRTITEASASEFSDAQAIATGAGVRAPTPLHNVQPIHHATVASPRKVHTSNDARMGYDSSFGAQPVFFPPPFAYPTKVRPRTVSHDSGTGRTHRPHSSVHIRDRSGRDPGHASYMSPPIETGRDRSHRHSSFVTEHGRHYSTYAGAGGAHASQNRLGHEQFYPHPSSSSRYPLAFDDRYSSSTPRWESNGRGRNMGRDEMYTDRRHEGARNSMHRESSSRRDGDERNSWYYGRDSSSRREYY